MVVAVDGRKVNSGRPIDVGVVRDNAVVTLEFEGLPELSDGQVVTLYWEVNDGEYSDGVVITKNSDGRYEFTITSDMTNHEYDRAIAYINVASSSQNWNSREFAMLLHPLRDIVFDVPAPESTQIEQLTAAAAACQEAAGAANDAASAASANAIQASVAASLVAKSIPGIIADRFDKTKAYSAGDYVTEIVTTTGNNGVSVQSDHLYRLTEPHTAGDDDYTGTRVRVCDVLVDHESRLANSEKALAITNHYDSFGPMMKVAESYFKEAYATSHRIVYRSERGLFYEDTDYEGEHAIVCSMLVEACLYGIYYENSRYVQSVNQRSHWGYMTDGTGHYPSTYTPDPVDGFMDDYMTAAYLAKYCDEHGWLHEFSSDRKNQIMPGDLLFFSSSSSPNWNQIVHVAFCVRAYLISYTIIEATGNNLTRLSDNQSVGVGIDTYTFSQKPISYYARMPLASATYQSELIDAPADSYSGTYNAVSKLVATRTYSQNLPQGFYTVTFRDTGSSVGGYVKVHYANGTEKNYAAQKLGKEISIVLFAETPVASIDFRVTSTLNEGAAEATYNVSDIKVYKGYRPLDA